MTPNLIDLIVYTKDENSNKIYQLKDKNLTY